MNAADDDVASRADTVTVVITTRDRPRMALRALRSALSQSLPPTQIVVVDDGSEPVFELGDVDPRVELVRLERPGGVSAARNAGLARARSRWVTFLDDDDELDPRMLELSLAGAARSELPPPVAVLSAVETVAADGSTERIRFPTSLPRGRDYFLDGAPVTVGNSLVAPREVLLAIGGFDEALRSAEHSELLLRVNARCSIEAVPSVTYRILRHHEGHIHGDPLARARAMERTERKHPAAFRRHRRAHAEYLSATAIWYLKAGEWRTAVRISSRGVLVEPWDLRAVSLWLVTLGGPASRAIYRRVARPLVRRRRRDRRSQ